MLRDPDGEHILLLNGAGEYELTPYEPIETADPRVRAYLFRRKGASIAVFWQTDGDGTLRLPLGAPIMLTREIDREALRFDVDPADGALLLPIGDRAYLATAADEETIRRAFASCALV